MWHRTERAVGGPGGEHTSAATCLLPAFGGWEAERRFGQSYVCSQVRHLSPKPLALEACGYALLGLGAAVLSGKIDGVI